MSACASVTAKPRLAGGAGRLPATSPRVSLRDKAAIVGIGQLPFSKNIGRSEEVTALEAARLALDDAGLRPSDIDGMSKWSIQVTAENAIARNLGVPNLRWFGEVGYGGGGGCGVVGHAAAAIAAGMARCVLVYRSRNRGSGGRPWAGTSRERDQSQARATRPPSSRPTASCGRSTRWRCSRVASCTSAATRTRHLGWIAVSTPQARHAATRWR